jgi:hypothetical protein
MCIPIVKVISEKFRCVGCRYNIRTVFKTKHTLRIPFIKTGPERDLQQTARCICIIPCECGRSYIGKTGRPLAVRLHKHSSLKEGLNRKVKISPHGVSWDEARIFEIESNSRYRKYKGFSPYGMLSQSDRPTQFGYFSHLDLSYQQ